jgi:hypothetical protein
VTLCKGLSKLIFISLSTIDVSALLLDAWKINEVLSAHSQMVLNFENWLPCLKKLPQQAL